MADPGMRLPGAMADQDEGVRYVQVSVEDAGVLGCLAMWGAANPTTPAHLVAQSKGALDRLRARLDQAEAFSHPPPA